MSEHYRKAAALRDRAIAEQNRGRPAVAMRMQRQALELLDLDGVQGRDSEVGTALLMSLGLNIAELEDVDLGLRTVDEARVRAEGLGNRELVVKAYSNSALIALRAGRTSSAIERFELARRLLSHASSNDRFAVLLNLGTLRMSSHQLAAGREPLVQAGAVAREAHIELGEFKALHNLAYLDFLLGDLPRALSGMEDASRVGPAYALGIPLLDRARVLVEAGLTREAEGFLRQAVEIFRRDRLTQDLAETELELARCALISSDVSAARRFAGRARTRFARRGSERWRQSAELVLLQAELDAGRSPRRLIGSARRLRDELVAEGLGVLAKTAGLIAAEAALAAGDPVAATTDIQRLGRDSRREPITYRLHSTYVRARLDAATGKPGGAASRLRRGLADLAAYQASFGSLELSTAAAIHGRRLVALDTALAVRSGRPDAIFAAAERGRAVTSRLAPVRPPEDPVTAELLAELRHTIESLRGVELDPAAAAPMLRRRRDLETQISQRAWTRRGAGAVSPSAELSEVQGALGDQAMLVFTAVDDVAGVLVITATSAHHLQLGDVRPVRELIRRARADLDALAQPLLPSAIAVAVRASFDHTMIALDAQLVRPLGVDRRLVLVTTGLLGQLPWGCMPSLRGRPLVVAPSASAWLTASRSTTRRRRTRLVSVAGPGLGRADEEAKEVAARWGTGKVLAAGDATGAKVSRSLASARVVHIAAHGVHQNESPLFSSIRLADGPLFAHELDQAAGTPEHVVLSACELGLASVRPGDEALGLTSVLLRLGTRSVVAGVARIGDDHAAETMSSYHQLLAAGRDSPSALAEAMTLSSRPVPLVAFGAEWAIR